MKNSFGFVLFLALHPWIYGQCPNFDVALNSQVEIDNFAINYPGCTQFNHELRIEPVNGSITNLLGLSQLTSIAHVFIISTEINSLEGLHNVTEVNDLALWGNSNLQNLEGLNALTLVDGLELFINSGLQNLNGIVNLQSIERLNLFANTNLVDISALSFVTHSNSITIGGNALTDLHGLENLQSVSQDLSITTETIQNLDELSNLNQIGGSLYLAYLPVLNDISALGQISTLEDLYFLECGSLASLAGLENLHTVNGNLRIGFMPVLSALNSLSGVTEVSGLEIYENPFLTSLTGFEQLTTIHQNAYIMDNFILNDISALSNVVPEELSELVIARNPNLSMCDNDFVCSVIFDIDVIKFIDGNGVGCGSIPQVAANCILSSGSPDLQGSIMVMPNPVSEYLTIELPPGIEHYEVDLYSSIGQRLHQGKSLFIDFSMYAKGVYFLRIATNLGSVVRKVVKE